MTLQAMCADLALRVNDATDRSQLKAALADAATLAATSSNIKSGKAPKRILDRLEPSTLGFICSDWKLPPAGLKSGDYESLARQVVTTRIQDACLTRPSLEAAASTGHPPPSVAELSSEDEGPVPPFEPAAYTPAGSSAASYSSASVAPFSSAEYTPSCPGSAGSHASDETYDVPCGPPPAWSLKYANRRGVYMKIFPYSSPFEKPKVAEILKKSAPNFLARPNPPPLGHFAQTKNSLKGIQL